MGAKAKTWRNRIAGTGEESPDQLVANPRNWRTHPGNQREALRGSLDTVGWVQQIVVNRTTGHVVDGHARVEEALTRGEKTVPVLYVELTEDEEAFVLATLDPIGALADMNRDALLELLDDIQIPAGDVERLFSGLGAFDVSAVAPADLPTGDRAGFRQMSFILSDEQAEVVTDALRRSKDVGPFDSDNENSNGNALARIAETYCGLG